MCVSELSLRANDVAVVHAHLSPCTFSQANLHRSAGQSHLPLVVLIGRHKDMLVTEFKREGGEKDKLLANGSGYKGVQDAEIFL